MLAIDPSKRPQSARELLAAVHHCYVRFEPQARSRRIRFARVAAVLALLALAALVAIIAMFSRYRVAIDAGCAREKASRCFPSRI